MVKQIKSKGKVYFQCEACDMFYKKLELAQKCEDWCSKHHSCNIDIIKDAVKDI